MRRTKRKIGRKAVVLLSGGLDSTVSLWWARKKGYQCRAISFDYGQRHKKELSRAVRIARSAGVPHQSVRFFLPWGGSSLTDRSRTLPTRRSLKAMSKRIPSTYVPARNTVFLSFALSLADKEKASAIIIGANAVDYSGYPDCRPSYLDAFEKTANHGTQMGTEGKRRIKIHAPLLRLTKADIVRLGKRLGAPLYATWSCYAGGARPCGRCDSCRLREKGFKEAGIIDEALVRH